MKVAGQEEVVLLWASGALVQRHFCSPPVFERLGLKGKRILEVGASSGLLSIELARLGAHVTAVDIEPDLTLLRRQIEAYAAPVRAVELLWGEQGWEQSPLKDEQEPFDVIFCADLIAIEDFHEDLLWTLLKLIGPRTVCYFAFKNRQDWSFAFMAALHDTRAYTVQDVDHIDRSNLEDPEDMLVYEIRRAQ